MTSPPTSQEELRRLEHGPPSGEEYTSVGIVRFVARCLGNAPEVLARVKEVLAAVLRVDARVWPTTEEWRSLLPAWFVQQSAPERTQAEQQQYVEWFRTLSPSEQAHEAAEEVWSVAAFVSWMEPGGREWWWWDGFVVDRDTVVVEVDVADRPFATGALDWLLRAAGAVSIAMMD